VVVVMVVVVVVVVVQWEMRVRLLPGACLFVVLDTLRTVKPWHGDEGSCWCSKTPSRAPATR
jgi:hypothetical protein